jgi:hypothetical protein
MFQILNQDKMSTNLDKYIKDLERLLEESTQLQIGMLTELKKLAELSKKMKSDIKGIKPINFTDEYERWYTESCAVIKQLLPDRLDDFKVLYKNEKRKETTYQTYTMSDYMIGLATRRYGETIVDRNSAVPKFQQQIRILLSAKSRFTSSIFDLKQIVQADIFDSEIEAAKELLKNGFIRAAGAIAGVVLERHLHHIIEKHELKFQKKNPGISDLNGILKDAETIDIAQWRFIQHLGDLRNKCDHKKEREPTKNEIEDLIIGVDKILKTVN